MPLMPGPGGWHDSSGAQARANTNSGCTKKSALYVPPPSTLGGRMLGQGGVQGTARRLKVSGAANRGSTCQESDSGQSGPIGSAQVTVTWLELSWVKALVPGKFSQALGTS